MNKDNAYYIVVTEWLYPTESGRELCDDYDTYERALEVARQLVEDERRDNWSEATHTDPSTIDFNCDSNSYIKLIKTVLKIGGFKQK